MTDTASGNKKTIINPIIKQSSRFHGIWLLPVLAIIVLIGLFWDAITYQNQDVTVQFDSAQGIVVGKTEVKYNGIIIGKVNNIRATKNLKKVEVQLQINENYKTWINNKTCFWLVKPNISFSGITGLDTIISGNYIAIKPGTNGKPQNYFVALKTLPVEADTSWLHITLVTNKLHSVTIGSPVYFNQIEVGKITGYSLNTNTQKILINLAIAPKYVDLVHNNSRFWSVSGFHIQASLKGVKIKSESLAALIKGGVAFYTPTWERSTAPASNGDQFILHNSFEDAQLGIRINIRFPLHNRAITKGTSVMFHGLEVGKVSDVSINSDLEHFTAQVIIDPDAKDLLLKNTRFSIVRPQVDLSGISDVPSLFRGPYIAVDTSKNSIKNSAKKEIEKTNFIGYENRYYTPSNLSGLNFVLKAKSLGGLRVKSPVLFKGLPIGKIEYARLARDGGYIYLSVNIFPEYQHLINQSSYFENVSGFSINASLSGLKVKSESLTSLVSGGIVAYTPTPDANALKPHSMVTLHSNKIANPDDLKLSLVSHNLGSVTKGIPILYLGVPVGKVTGYHIDNPANKVVIEVVINAPYRHLVTKKSRFWNVSGVKIKGGLLSGISLSAHSLQTIVKGGIAFATPEPDKRMLPVNTHFVLHDKAMPEWKTWRPKIMLKH